VTNCRMHNYCAIAVIGGLGSPAALYLAAAGVGRLILVDDDLVELTNLQRQIAHTQNALGEAKVDSAKSTINALNADVNVECVQKRLTETDMHHWVSQANVVLDCSDNFMTRTALNRVDARDANSPCYQCLYDISGEQGLTCSESGVLGPVVGVIGAAQALEALKVLTPFGLPLVGRVQMFDALTMQWREFKLPRDKHCAVCAPK